MGLPLRVLIAEDSEDDTALLVGELRRGGYDPVFERVDTPAGMGAALAERTWDIVISDYSMPGFDGLAALGLLQKSGLDLPFIMVSGSIGEDLAVEAMKAGAHDYIMKGNMKRLVPAIKRELHEAEVRRERRQAEETIRHLAYYDLLTDLPNRVSLHDRLQQAILDGQREGHPVAFLLLDLDRFKEINDTLGHHRGDFLLQEVGTRLRGAIWEPDIVARLGGDEFAVLLLRLAAAEHINVVVRKIIKALEAPFVIEGLPIAVEASIGSALYPDHGANADSLIQRADIAMYAAKQTGSGYAIYAPKLDQHSPRKLALMGELRRAIENDQLCLYYQPKVSLKTGRVIGVEALARWQHPEHGFIPPDQFIAPAERTGLIRPLTLWVFHTAQSQCMAWHQAGTALGMAINLSARNLHDPQLPDQLAELIKRCGPSPIMLELEITESTIMADPARAMDILTRLRAMGIRFAIDDFGTGYSSLSYLKKLPVDTIKIDRSFVMHMVTHQDDAVIVRSTVEMAHHLGLKVVAEGVENRETWDRLVELGCDAAQGYYMCRPIPADELTRWLSESPFGLGQKRK